LEFHTICTSRTINRGRRSIFNTVVDAISEKFIELKFPIKGTPSTTYNGSEFALTGIITLAPGQKN
jgi:hypothetical protein